MMVFMAVKTHVMAKCGRLLHHSNQTGSFNSLAPRRFEEKFWQVIFKLISLINGWGISCEIARRWVSLDFTDGQSTLVQVMAWCRQATSHYLSQCWPRSLSPYGITRPLWVNMSSNHGSLDKVKATSGHIVANKSHTECEWKQVLWR